MAVSVVERPVNNAASQMVGLQAVDDTRFLHVFADWNGTNAVLKGRIGTINASTGSLAFSAESNILNLPNYASPGAGRPNLCAIAVLSSTQAAIQWVDGYRSYYFTPLTLDLAAGTISAGTTQNTFGVGTYDEEASRPSRFCAMDASHYCATFRLSGGVRFGVMDATCVAVGAPISVGVGGVPEAQNIIALDAARSQFLPFTIDYAAGAYAPNVGMVTPGSPPMKVNNGVAGPNRYVTGLNHLDDTHSFYLAQPDTSTLRVETVVANGTSHAVSVTEDPLVISLPSVTYTNRFGNPATAHVLAFDAVMVDATHALVVGPLFYPPTPTDDLFGRLVMRTYYWTLVWDGSAWSLPDAPEMLELDSVAITQGQVVSLDAIVMGASGWTITAWNQNTTGSGSSPNRLAIFAAVTVTITPPPPPPPPPVVAGAVRSGTAQPVADSQHMADASTILSLRNIDGPIPVTPVAVIAGGIWRTGISLSSAGFGEFVPHDRDTGLALTNNNIGGLEVQAWSMVAHEPIKVDAQTVLASTPLGAVTADGYGLELTAMGDQSGFALAYDRGQPGTSSPTTLYAQLVHFDGADLTAGPQFGWDAVAHSCYRPGAAFTSFSHQIVGLSATRAVRFWFCDLGAGSLAIRAQLLDFSAAIGAAPAVTEFGVLPGEPTAGVTIPTLWAQRCAADVAAVYWTEAITSPAAHVASFVTAPLWTRLTPDPLVALGITAGSLPYAFGSPNGLDDVYFAGMHPSPFSSSAIDVIVAADSTGAISEAARRTQVDPVFDPVEILTGLTNAVGPAPGAASLNVEDPVEGQLLRLSLWSRFTVSTDKTVAMTDPTMNPYAGVLVAGSVLQYNAGKLVSSTDAMFLANWTDNAGGSGDPGWYVTHARFAPPPRGTVAVIDHVQKMRSKSGVRR